MRERLEYTYPISDHKRFAYLRNPPAATGGFLLFRPRVPVFWTSALILAAACSLPSVACAQLPAPPVNPSDAEVLEAREAFVRGTQFGAEDRFEEARREFLHSYALSGSPVALFNLASSLRSLDLHREAAEAFIRLLANPDLDARIRSRAAPMYAQVVAHVTRLRLYGQLDRATLRIDGGLPMPLAGQTHTVVVDPGRHELVANRRASAPWTWSGSTEPGTSLDLLVDLDPLTSSATGDEPETDDTPWIAAGVCTIAAALLVGVIVGVVLDAEAQLGPRTPFVIELP